MLSFGLGCSEFEVVGHLGFGHLGIMFCLIVFLLANHRVAVLARVPDAVFGLLDYWLFVFQIFQEPILGSLQSISRLFPTILLVY